MYKAVKNNHTNLRYFLIFDRTVKSKILLNIWILFIMILDYGKTCSFLNGLYEENHTTTYAAIVLA